MIGYYDPGSVRSRLFGLVHLAHEQHVSHDEISATFAGWRATQPHSASLSGMRNQAESGSLAASRIVPRRKYRPTVSVSTPPSQGRVRCPQECLDALCLNGGESGGTQALQPPDVGGLAGQILPVEPEARRAPVPHLMPTFCFLPPLEGRAGGAGACRTSRSVGVEEVIVFIVVG